MTAPLRCRDPKLGALTTAYELGLLGPEDQARFEAHLDRCPACLENLYDGAVTAAVLRLAPGEAARRLPSAPAPARPRGWRWPVPWRLLAPTAVAAALLLLILGRGGSPDLAGLARLDPLPHVKLETRLAQRPADRLGFEEAMEAYRRGAYAAAAPRLAALTRRPAEAGEGTRVEQAALYAGVSFLLAAQADSARAYLERGLASRLPVLRDRSRWYLVQALLLQEQGDAARDHLQALAEQSPGYGDLAREQLRELEERRGR